MTTHRNRLREMANKPPGLYTSRKLYKRACLLAAQPKTIENAMDRWEGGPETVYIDELLMDDDWYIVTAPQKA
jgi:hypothetical protein